MPPHDSNRLIPGLSIIHLPGTLANLRHGRVNQVVGTQQRGATTAFSGGMGQVGGIISSVIYPIKDGPMYVPGISTCIAFSFLGIIMAIIMSACCWWENNQRSLGKRDHLRQLPPDAIAKLGAKHPDFRYTI